MEETKRCPKCKTIKQSSDFNADKKSRSGLCCWCKLCIKEKSDLRYRMNRDHVMEINRVYVRENKQKHAESCKKWYEENKEEYLISCKERYNKNNPKLKETRRKYYIKNKENIYKRERKWAAENKDKIRIYGLRSIKKIKSTPKGKLSINVSAYIRESLKGSKHGRHWEDLVPYTLDQLHAHLESQFKSGMSWDNYGLWHIDHKTPVSVFNFIKPEDSDFKKCWALNNLQPLWARENCSKGKRIDFPFQPSLTI